MRILVPQFEFAADLTCVLLRLFLNPAFDTDFSHFSQIVYDVLVMTDPIHNMDLAEVKQSLTWKFGAFKATLHSVFVCTSTEAMGTDHAIAPHFVGKAAVTLLRIVGAGAAE